MNRDIRFRGLRVDGKGWAYGCLFTDCNGVKYILPCGQTFWRTESDGVSMRSVTDSHHVKPETVGQFINMVTYNKGDIYEHDIVTGEFAGMYSVSGVVRFVDGEYLVCPEDESHAVVSIIDLDNIKVVGNIHTK